MHILELCINHKYALEIPDSYTAPCNAIVSHGLNLGVFRFLPTTHAKTKVDQFAHNLNAPCNVLSVFCLHVHPPEDTATYAPDKPWLILITRKNLKTPNSSPMDKDGTGLGIFGICGCVLMDVKGMNVW